jgi:dihydrofolate reductase
MRKLIMFNMISVNGFFEGPNHDITWHTVDEEFNDFAIKQIDEVDTILFGRVTYELMESYWPTEAAIKDDPVIAKAMNTKRKIVISSTMKAPTWSNTTLISRDAPAELNRMKHQAGRDLIIFGSASLCSSLIKARTIDEFRILISPTVLVNGTPLLRDKISLTLKDTRKFGNGNVLLTYSAGA